MPPKKAKPKGQTVNPPSRPRANAEQGLSPNTPDDEEDNISILVQQMLQDQQTRRANKRKTLQAVKTKLITAAGNDLAALELDRTSQEVKVHEDITAQIQSALSSKEDIEHKIAESIRNLTKAYAATNQEMCVILKARIDRLEHVQK